MSIFNINNTRGLENLEFLARQTVEGFIIGLHKSPFHGFSVEFSEHRLYNPGESTKNIDWRVFARSDKMFVKRFEEETNLRCHIMVDISSSMHFPENQSTDYKGQNKLVFSALGAASMMNLLKRQRDAFGLCLFDEKIKLLSQCKSTSSHYRMLLSQMEKFVLSAKHNSKTNLVQTIHEIADNIHKRSLVVIFSDAFENTGQLPELFEALKHLKYNQHEVVLFHTLDKKLELDFEFKNRPYEFIDLESGEKLKLQSNLVKESYQRATKEYTSSLRSKCLQYKIDYVPCDIREGYDKILQSYLVKRSKMIH